MAETFMTKARTWRYPGGLRILAAVVAGSMMAVTWDQPVARACAQALPFYHGSAQAAGNNGIVRAVRKVEPAVFAVVNYARVTDFFTQAPKLEAAGVGTGVLFNKDRQYAYVVTNSHVVAEAAKVQIVLPSGRHVPAKVAGSDPYTDLAVLRVPGTDVAKIEAPAFADSDAVQVGEPAIAIGTPMGLDFADTVTAGIVSAKQRMMPVEQEQTQQVLDYQPVIQTDAAINPGNSGGPLINIRGQVIGINSSKIVAPSFEGMGFAIPSNAVRQVADQIIHTGHALHPALGISGVALAALPEELWPDVPVDYGVWVRRVTSPEAKRAGLRMHDVIVGIGGKTVKTMADLRTCLFQHRPGDAVALRIYRSGRPLEVRVTLTEMATDAVAGAGRSHAEADDVPLSPFSIPNKFWE